MKKYIKPIPSTPMLDGEDTTVIIKEALRVPSKRAIERNEKRLSDIRKVLR